MIKKHVTITIAGPANTGKTAIAQHIAWELSNHFGIAAAIVYEEGDEAAPINQVEQILTQLSERIEVEVTTRHTPNRASDRASPT